MPWENTTHDWAAAVDHEHLVLEVLAYAADEAESTGPSLASGDKNGVLHLNGLLQF